MPVQHFKQFHQGQGRLGLAVFAARKGVHAAAEDFGRLALVQIEFLAHLGDVARIDIGRIHVPLKYPDGLAVAVTVLPVQDQFAATLSGSQRYPLIVRVSSKNFRISLCDRD